MNGKTQENITKGWELWENWDKSRRETREAGNSRHTDGCDWFLGNFPYAASNKFSVIQLTNVELADVEAIDVAFSELTNGSE